MKVAVIVLAMAGSVALVGAAAERIAGTALAFAQSRSNACFQNCKNVRDWPAAQCRQYCRGRSKR